MIADKIIDNLNGEKCSGEKKFDKLISVRNLSKYFPLKGGIFGRVKDYVRAVDDVSFDVGYKETLGLVGESGSGKTTVGRTILRLIERSSGEVLFKGENIFSLDKKRMRELRKKMQIIFQDPAGSLNPRMTVERIIGEGLILHKLVNNRKELRERVVELLEQVGLSGDYLSRYPHEFSGGQRQRIGIARALAVKPEFIVADEPVSALDVSIQSQILNLLGDLKEQYDLSFLFIAHNLAVVEFFCDKIAVMYLGRIVEYASSDEIYANPLHPYTRLLLEAIPVPDPSRHKKFAPITGELGSAVNPPSGCYFHPRCPYADEQCRTSAPSLISVKNNASHKVSCWKYDKI